MTRCLCLSMLQFYLADPLTLLLTAWWEHKSKCFLSHNSSLGLPDLGSMNCQASCQWWDVGGPFTQFLQSLVSSFEKIPFTSLCIFSAYLAYYDIKFYCSCHKATICWWFEDSWSQVPSSLHDLYKLNTLPIICSALWVKVPSSISIFELDNICMNFVVLI